MRHTQFVLAALAAICGAVLPASPACGQCQYEVTIIQAPPCPTTGPPPTIGLSLNEHGHVVGYYYSCGIPADRPFLWTPDGGFQPLPMPDGAIEAKASDINDEGVICGTALGPPIGQQGFVYENGQFTLLPPQPGGAWASAYAINNAGQVVGFRSIGPGVNPYNAFIWSQAEGFTDLGIQYGEMSSASDISDAGIAVGWSGPFIGCDAFLWGDSEPTFLGHIPQGVSSKAAAVNSLEYITGQGFIDLGGAEYVGRAFVWREGEWTVIEPLPGDDSSGAIDINDSGQTLCMSTDMSDLNTDRSFLWHNGRVYDLDDLLPAGVDGMVKRPKGLNNGGQLLAQGTDQAGDVVTFLFTPVNPRPGDLNSDCHTDAADLQLLLAEWGAGASVADLNTDGVVNVLDLLFLLAHWG